MFMAGGNTDAEKNFYQLGYSAANIEKDKEIVDLKRDILSGLKKEVEKDKEIARLREVIRKIYVHFGAGESCNPYVKPVIEICKNNL